MTAGGGVTYPRVVELLKIEVAVNGQRAAARKIKLPLLSVQRYIKGIGEPSQATLVKLADYFKVSVAELRGETYYLWDLFRKDDNLPEYQQDFLNRILSGLCCDEEKEAGFPLHKCIQSLLKKNIYDHRLLSGYIEKFTAPPMIRKINSFDDLKKIYAENKTNLERQRHELDDKINSLDDKINSLDVAHRDTHKALGL